MLRYVFPILLGKLVKRAILRLRPGGGTAIPGRVVERLAPGLLAYLLTQPRQGVVVVTGSSGKSTTTKMVVAVLRAHGLDVFTNRFTANVTRGMLSELLDVVDWRGRFPHEIAVMEMDEGYSAITMEQVPARVLVLLNVMVDQLHRWFEPERVASYLQRAARVTTECVVINQDDPHLRLIAQQLPEQPGRSLRYFGVSDEVLETVPRGLGSAADFSGAAAAPLPGGKGHSLVIGFAGTSAAIAISAAETSPATPVSIELPSRGIHFATDSAAAIEASRAILGASFDPDKAAQALAEIPTVFGRGEKTVVDGEPVEFVLTKSPTSIQINLDYLDDEPEQIYVAIGKDILDGSQLWISDWSRLGHADMISGWQSWDSALKLHYDNVLTSRVEPDIEIATSEFFRLPPPTRGQKTVIFTPESMRRLRRLLGFFYADTAPKPEGTGDGQ
ncbi:MAG: Mur ligase family protein [Microbacteriaceae bacterium]